MQDQRAHFCKRLLGCGKAGCLLPCAAGGELPETAVSAQLQMLLQWILACCGCSLLENEQFSCDRRVGK
jgi:hypothetical protein